MSRCFCLYWYFFSFFWKKNHYLIIIRRKTIWNYSKWGEFRFDFVKIGGLFSCNVWCSWCSFYSLCNVLTQATLCILITIFFWLTSILIQFVWKLKFVCFCVHLNWYDQWIKFDWFRKKQIVGIFSVYLILFFSLSLNAIGLFFALISWLICTTPHDVLDKTEIGFFSYLERPYSTVSSIKAFCDGISCEKYAPVWQKYWANAGEKERQIRTMLHYMIIPIEWQWTRQTKRRENMMTLQKWERMEENDTEQESATALCKESMSSAVFFCRAKENHLLSWCAENRRNFRFEYM